MVGSCKHTCFVEAQGWKRPHLTEFGHINWRKYSLGVSGQWLSFGNLLIK